MKRVPPSREGPSGEAPAPQDSAGPAANPEQQPGTTPSPPRPRQRVLVADDETHVRDLAELVLGNSGFDVTCARDGEEAWLLLSGNPFDLLLTDRDMPGMNGLDLIARARRSLPALPIILMSGTAPAATEAAWAAAKPDAFLPKPFTVAALLAIVHAMLTAT